LGAETRSLKDTVVAVTGATSGIGRATARELVDAGCRIVVSGRRQDRLNALAGEFGGRCVACPGDVRRPGDATRLVKAALDGFGQLDSVVIAAGVGAYGSILDYSDEELQEIIDTNLAGTVWAVRAALPAMLRAGGGDLVLVASVAGFRGGGNEAVYAATKFAQVGLAGSLDRELREKGVRVSVISPAAVHTEFAMGRGRDPEMAGLEQMLRPEDVAQAVRSVLEQPRRLRTQHWTMWSMDEAS
jgi:NADP-dependent 3-hydroxy acid dehydrogenase YdfG